MEENTLKCRSVHIQKNAEGILDVDGHESGGTTSDRPNKESLTKNGKINTNWGSKVMLRGVTDTSY